MKSTFRLEKISSTTGAENEKVSYLFKGEIASAKVELKVKGERDEVEEVLDGLGILLEVDSLINVTIEKASELTNDVSDDFFAKKENEN